MLEKIIFVVHLQEDFLIYQQLMSVYFPLQSEATPIHFIEAFDTNANEPDTELLDSLLNTPDIRQLANSSHHLLLPRLFVFVGNALKSRIFVQY